MSFISSVSSTVPDEFAYDPVTKTYGEPQRRPEIKSSTIEFIAPSDYMVRKNCLFKSQLLETSFDKFGNFLHL